MANVAKTMTVQNAVLMPVSGAGVNIVPGTLMATGATANLNFSILIPQPVTAGEGVTALPFGVLLEPHVYATVGDALTQTLMNWFPGFADQTVPSHYVQLLDSAHVINIPYNLAPAAPMAVTSVTGSSLSYNITSVDAYLEGGFFYINAGSGIGQLAYVSSSSAGSAAVILSALTTVGTATSRLVKILPNLYGSQAAATAPLLLAATSTAPQSIDTTAAAGTHYRAITLASYISLNGIITRLDPLAHHNLQGLNSISSLAFNCDLNVNNSVFHPLA